jgi:hypothetical protein
MNKYQKKFPEDYSNEVSDIINKMSLTDGANVNVVGSMGLRTQLYANDYDCYEKIEVHRNMEFYAKKFQEVIDRLMETPLCYIMDIKCGSIKEWQIIDDDVIIENEKVKNFDADQSKKKLKLLFDKNIISSSEFNFILKKIKKEMSINDLFELKDFCKFHIIRWKPKEVLVGYKKLIDGSMYTLIEGLQSKSVSKLDVISWVNGNHFSDFSIIYQFMLKGKPVNGVMEINSETMIKSVKDDILYYYNKNNYFKMCKRLFILAKMTNDNLLMEFLTNLFNGDLGRIYVLYGDVQTLEHLVENDSNIPFDKIEFEIEQFRHRLANITIPAYFKKRDRILDIVEHLENIESHNRPKMLKELKSMKRFLEELLSEETKKHLESKKLIPLNERFLP